jgi:hypothetical protein
VCLGLMKVGVWFLMSGVVIMIMQIGTVYLIRVEGFCSKCLVCFNVFVCVVWVFVVLLCV